jgi:hypothetical protein
LKPFDELTCARLKQRSNNNVNPEVKISTTIDEKLTDLLTFLAESQFKEDSTSIVLSVGKDE